MSDANTAVLRKLAELDARCVEINQQICDPEIAQDVNKLIPLSKEQGKLMPLVSRYRDYIKITSELEDAQVMLDDPEMKEMAAALRGDGLNDAAALAAALFHGDTLQSDTVICVASGGNVDADIFIKALQDHA